MGENTKFFADQGLKIDIKQFLLIVFDINNFKENIQPKIVVYNQNFSLFFRYL